jgi:hypothetical protein
VALYGKPLVVQTGGDMGGIGIDDFPEKDLVTDGKGGNFHMNLNRT